MAEGVFRRAERHSGGRLRLLGFQRSANDVLADFEVSVLGRDAALEVARQALTTALQNAGDSATASVHLEYRGLLRSAPPLEPGPPKWHKVRVGLRGPRSISENRLRQAREFVVNWPGTRNLAIYWDDQQTVAVLECEWWARGRHEANDEAMDLLGNAVLVPMVAGSEYSGDGETFSLDPQDWTSADS